MLTGITGCPPRAEIRKAALGAEEAVPWRYEKSAERALRVLREQGYFLLALEKTPQSALLHTLEVRRPLALIVGNEFEGISAEVLALAHAVGHLPMRGHKVSLNVSVAFGIAAYELGRRFAPDQ